MDRNLAEFHRQYGERVKQLEEIIQQASSKEAGTKQRTNPDHSGHHRADDKQSGGDTTEQPTNYSTYERTKPTARPPRGGGIRSIRS